MGINNKFIAIHHVTHYELTNHLGNVLSVITPDANDATQPAIERLTDYYPFGMEEPGRSYSAEGYRYGFNTQEKVQELGAGHITALYWEYDGRLGRRWNVDPVIHPFESSYNCFHNNPTFYSDPDGNDPPEASKEYIVQSGDNLINIAKNNNVSVKELVLWNSIKNPNKILVGTKLSVSDPRRWLSDGEGHWRDKNNPEELWQKVDGKWKSLTFGDFYEQIKKEGGETILSLSNEDVQGYKEIIVSMVSWASCVFGTGGKTTNVKKKHTIKPGPYKPELRLEYESEVVKLREVAAKMKKEGYSVEYIAQTLKMRRELGI